MFSKVKGPITCPWEANEISWSGSNKALFHWMVEKLILINLFKRQVDRIQIFSDDYIEVFLLWWLWMCWRSWFRKSFVKWFHFCFLTWLTVFPYIIGWVSRKIENLIVSTKPKGFCWEIDSLCLSMWHQGRIVDSKRSSFIIGFKHS